MNAIGGWLCYLYSRFYLYGHCARPLHYSHSSRPQQQTSAAARCSACIGSGCKVSLQFVAIYLHEHPFVCLLIQWHVSFRLTFSIGDIVQTFYLPPYSTLYKLKARYDQPKLHGQPIVTLVYFGTSFFAVLLDSFQYYQC